MSKELLFMCCMLSAPILWKIWKTSQKAKWLERVKLEIQMYEERLRKGVTVTTKQYKTVDKSEGIGLQEIRLQNVDEDKGKVVLDRYNDNTLFKDHATRIGTLEMEVDKVEERDKMIEDKHDQTDVQIEDKVNAKTGSDGRNGLAKYYPAEKEKDYPLSVLPNPYMIRNGDVCTNASSLKFVVIVTSAAPNFIQRQNIRHTWGNTSLYKPDEVKVVFILGKPRVGWLQKHIERENGHFHDIVQGTFLDSYFNLTHKSVLGVRWVSEHCRNARMVVKVDDDVVVNVFELLYILEGGHCFDTAAVELHCHLRPYNTSRIFRADGNKWRVDPDYFPRMAAYPFPYCDGMFTVLTPGAAAVLYETAAEMPYFWIEDVYLTGILPAARGHGVKLTDLAGVLTLEDDGLDCLELHTTGCYVVAALASTTHKIRRMWAHIQDYYSLQ